MAGNILSRLRTISLPLVSIDALTDDGSCNPSIVATEFISVADKIEIDRSASWTAYRAPTEETVIQRIGEGRCGRKFFRPESSCQKTMVDSLPPDMI